MRSSEEFQRRQIQLGTTELAIDTEVRYKAAMLDPNREYFFGPTGARLRVMEWGPLDAPPVLLVHGFPGCAEQGMLMSQSPHWNSFRLIALDRPGYGKSQPQPKITALDFAKQVQDLLVHLRIQQLRILSVSGGAPYAFATAALLGSGVTRMASVGGVAPLRIPTLRWLNPKQKKTYAIQRLVPSRILHAAVRRVWEVNSDKIDDFFFSQTQTLPEQDRRVLEDPELGPVLFSTMKRALAYGPYGMLHDMRTFAKPWGFSLQDVSCPVDLWHGTKDDVVHRFFAKEMLRNLPSARLRMIPGEGHYSLLFHQRDAILQNLLT